MKILVTGGTGFLGRHLVRLLVDRGEEVRVLARNAPSPREDSVWASVEFQAGSVLDEVSVRAAIEGCDRVVHAAGRVSWDPADAEMLHRLHVEGTRTVGRVARDEEAVERLVHVSTSGTIGVSRDPDRVATEADPWATEVCRRWPYYLSKIYAEKVALDLDGDELEVCCVLPSLLLGPDDPNLSSTDVVARCLRGELPFIPPGGLSFVDVRDAARATAAALDEGTPGERWLLGGANLTFEAFWDLLADVSGASPPLVPLPSGLVDVVLGPLERAEELLGISTTHLVRVEMACHTWYISSKKAVDELGFTPRPARETLEDTVAWLREHADVETGGIGSFILDRVRGISDLVVERMAGRG